MRSNFPLRFSLRSLLLGVLALASGAALWRNFEPWRIERVFIGEKIQCDSATLSPDGKWIVADFRTMKESTTDGEDDVWHYKSILWNVASGRRTELVNQPSLADVKPSDSEFCSAFTDDSKRVLAGMRDRGRLYVSLWDVESQSEISLPERPIENRFSTWLSPGNQYLLFRLEDESTRVLDLKSTKVVANLSGIVHTINLSESGKYLAKYEIDESYSIVELATGREIHRVRPPLDWTFKFITHLSDNYMYAYVNWTEYYEQSNAMIRFHLNEPGRYEIYPGTLLGSSPDDSVAVLNVSGKLKILDMRTGLERPRDSVNADNICPWWINNSDCLIRVSGDLFYETSAERKVFKLPGGVGISPDVSRFIHCFNDGGMLAVHDLKSGEMLQPIPSEHFTFSRTLFSSDGVHFISQNSTSHAIHYWTRHRPERWWGLAWLPEFWLLIAFSAAFFSGLYRDRKPAHAK